MKVLKLHALGASIGWSRQNLRLDRGSLKSIHLHAHILYMILLNVKDKRMLVLNLRGLLIRIIFKIQFLILRHTLDIFNLLLDWIELVGPGANIQGLTAMRDELGAHPALVGSQCGHGGAIWKLWYWMVVALSILLTFLLLQHFLTYDFAILLLVCYLSSGCLVRVERMSFPDLMAAQEVVVVPLGWLQMISNVLWVLVLDLLRIQAFNIDLHLLWRFGWRKRWTVVWFTNDLFRSWTFALFISLRFMWRFLVQIHLSCALDSMLFFAKWC